MQLRSPAQLHIYQQRAVNFQCSHPNSALFLDVGLGKTSITLTSIAHLLNVQFLNAVIVVAPIRVCRLVWRQEALKWQHTSHLTFNMVMGTKDQRIRALMKPANVYVTNYENLKWLAETLHTYYISKGKPIPFNGVVFDEVDKCSNSATDRVKALLKVLPHTIWRTGLTGTPAANSYKDLHGQFLVLDGGQRLGRSKTEFERRFYKKVSTYKSVALPETETIIANIIGDMTLNMSAEDYNPLPDLIVNDVEVELPDNIRAKYEQMEKDFFLLLDNGTEKEMFNQASLTNTCLQMANGAIYPVAGMPLWEPVHDAKLEALEDIIDESNGQPVLCSYAYRSDAARIMMRFNHLDPINLTECKSESSLKNAMHRWTTGDCRLMIGHAACLGGDTQVLTERNGWTTITKVEDDDRVFDGVSFVNHGGCSYSGYKKVIDVFGITMTPDHKLLLNNEWVEAINVRDSEEIRNEAIHNRKKTEKYCFSKMSNLWGDFRNSSTKRNEEQQRGQKALYKLLYPCHTQHEQNDSIQQMAKYVEQGQRPIRQKLQGSWDYCLRRMVKLREVLGRYGSNISGWFNYRENRRKWSIQQRELQMDHDVQPTIKQTNESQIFTQWGNDSSCGVVSQNRFIKKCDYLSNQSRDECIGSDSRCKQHMVQKTNDVPRRVDSSCGNLSEKWSWSNSVGRKTENRFEYRGGYRGCEKISTFREVQEKKEHVYDLINCGPRHRFVIRNKEGEVFISHNSMGHGLDGLQTTGSTLVWFGLNWSYRLYEQFNGRLRRQGQGKPVICHRILCRDTMDQAQALALNDKANNQNALRTAVKNYRAMKQNSSNII